MVKIRLKKFGKKRQPSYRIVVMDARTNRDGKTIDEVGFYNSFEGSNHPKIRINLERIEYWLSKGAQPTDTARKLINKYKKIHA